MLAFADVMNNAFDQIHGNVNWAGLVLPRGARLEKYNGKRGNLSSIIGDCLAEIATKNLTVSPHINVVVYCDQLGINDDKTMIDSDLSSVILRNHTHVQLCIFTTKARRMMALLLIRETRVVSVGSVGWRKKLGTCVNFGSCF